MTRGLDGNGDAFNYSLSIADTVTQVRAGVIPPMVGQSEYAYNGRIHPLRTAPYLCFLAAGLDAVTLHKLTFWELQNLCIALSLAGSLFASFWALRIGTACSRWAAVFFSAVYVVSPPLLSAAYSFELFMTVCAAPFVPLAIGACIRTCRKPSIAADAGLSASLAGAWFAHPPIALWLTVGVASIRFVNLLAFPSWWSLLRYLGTAVLGITLSAYVLESVASLYPDSSPFSGEATVRLQTSRAILQKAQESFPGSLLPVSAHADKVSDVQLGFAGWGLLLVAIASCFRRAPKDPKRAELQDHLIVICTSSIAIFFLLLVLPVPSVTLWLWLHIPEAASDLTNIWPMYRLYIVTLGFVIFGAALANRSGESRLALPRALIWVGLLCSSAWLVWEASNFVRRGFQIQLDAEQTASRYRSSNLDLTITSYSFFGLSPWFVHGVSDPQFEFRILDAHGLEINSPIQAALATSPMVLQGKLHRLSITSRSYSTSFILEPRRRYLLTFDFKTKPLVGKLNLKGRLLQRSYYLPSAGGLKGFGMLAGESRTVVLWTDSERPETVEMGFDISDTGAAAMDLPDVFADFVLREVRFDDLPVRLKSLLPLRCSVDAPEDGCALETPRRFVPGYDAWVNGHFVAAELAKDGQILVPVPRGRSEVELRYVGPLRLRAAFWISAFAWTGLLAWASGVWRLPIITHCIAKASGIPAFLSGKRVECAMAMLAVSVTVMAWIATRSRERFLNSVGPVRIDFLPPYAQIGHVQPLLATGVPFRGTVISVTYPDTRHLIVSADVWGTLYQSKPIEPKIRS